MEELNTTTDKKSNIASESDDLIKKVESLKRSNELLKVIVVFFIIISVILGLILANFYNQGINESYNQGYDDGYDEGYNDSEQGVYNEDYLDYYSYDGNTSDTSQNSESNSNQTYSNSNNTQQSCTVYVTSTGNKYHKYWCHYLEQSCIPMYYYEACNQGYTACSYCH